MAQAIDYYNLLKFPNANILKTKQYILMTPVCAYFRKHSCLIKPFDDQIRTMKWNGMLAFWIRHYKVPTFYDNNNMEPKKLSFDQISGVLNVCMYLFGVSTILFIFELLSMKCKRIKMFLDFLSFNAKHRRVFWIAQRNRYSISLNSRTY